MTGFSVVLADPAFQDQRALAKALAALRGVPAIDAQQEAHRAWGILAENISAEEAAKLEAAAAAQGITLRALPAVPALSPATEIHGIAFDTEATRVLLGVPPVETSIPRSPLLVVAAVGLNEATSETKTVKEERSTGERLLRAGITLTTGIPLGFGGAKEVKRTIVGHELFLRFDLFFENGRYFGRPDRFDFSVLGERKTEGGFANLRLLLGTLGKEPGVFLNQGARALRDGKPLTALGYDSMTAYERECRWLCALASLKTQG